MVIFRFPYFFVNKFNAELMLAFDMYCLNFFIFLQLIMVLYGF